jgi:hypothetical protein
MRRQLLVDRSCAVQQLRSVQGNPDLRGYLLITTNPINHLGSPLVWFCPSGWSDLPPPPNVAIIISGDGRVIGRCARQDLPENSTSLVLSARPEYRMHNNDDPRAISSSMRHMGVAWAAAIIKSPAPEPHAQGMIRGYRWQALLLTMPNPPSFYELGYLPAFQPE